MNDILKRLLEYMSEHGVSQRDAAAMLGVSKNTITNWKNGGVIAPENVRAIRKLIGDKKSSDPFLQIVLDAWERLDTEDRGRLAGIAQSMAEKNTHCSQSADGTNEDIQVEVAK